MKGKIVSSITNDLIYCSGQTVKIPYAFIR